MNKFLLFLRFLNPYINLLGVCFQNIFRILFEFYVVNLYGWAVLRNLDPCFLGIKVLNLFIHGIVIFYASYRRSYSSSHKPIEAKQKIWIAPFWFNSRFGIDIVLIVPEIGILLQSSLKYESDKALIIWWWFFFCTPHCLLIFIIFQSVE